MPSPADQSPTLRQVTEQERRNPPVNTEAIFQAEAEEQEVRSLDPDVELEMFAVETSSRPAEMSQAPRVEPPPVEPPPAAPVVSDASADEPSNSRPLWSAVSSGSDGGQRMVAVAAVVALIGAGGLWLATHRTERAAGAGSPTPAQSVANPRADSGATAATGLPAATVAAPAAASPSPSTSAAASVPSTVATTPPVVATTPAVTPRPAPTPPPTTSSAADAGLLSAGWLKVEAPIDLDISTDGRVIGTSRSDRTLLLAGRQDLVLVNERLGFRTTQSVTISAGKLQTIQVRIPGGLVSVNAQPWAEVTIDGKAVGETPLGNLPIAAGVHEVVFTHPQLGQHKVEAVVRAGEHVRLNTNLNAPTAPAR